MDALRIHSYALKTHSYTIKKYFYSFNVYSYTCLYWCFLHCYTFLNSYFKINRLFFFFHFCIPFAIRILFYIRVTFRIWIPYLHTFLLLLYFHSHIFLLSYTNSYLLHSVPSSCKLFRLNSGARGEKGASNVEVWQECVSAWNSSLLADMWRNFEVIRRIKNLMVEQTMRNPCGEYIGSDECRNYENCAMSCYWSV